MKLIRRLEILEQRHSRDPAATLTMRDGRIEILRGDYMRELLSGACGGERTPTPELLAKSVASAEPGGGHLLELARTILNNPMDGKEMI